jgi:hypothetical protein
LTQPIVQTTVQTMKHTVFPSQLDNKIPFIMQSISQTLVLIGTLVHSRD